MTGPAEKMITSGPRRIVATALAVLMLSLQGAFAETRIALVIGNGAYEEGSLDNPPRDAELMADTLRDFDFEVTFEKDVDWRTMKRLIAVFGDRLRATSDAVAFFYYSGHGMQVKGRNYMIPVDARINDEPDVEIDGLSAESVLTHMEYARTTMNIVALDACRNNPFEKRFKSPQESVGLAPMHAPAGTLIAYATAPGDVANPGPRGGYSPFTATLANELRTSTASVLDLFNSVSTKVYEQTGREQRPYIESSVVPRLALGGPIKPAVGVYPTRPVPGSALRDCPECPEMVLVPAGEFTMGSPPDEPDRYYDEGPQRKVTIPEPFWVSKYEVTFSEWDACVAAGGCKLEDLPLWVDDSSKGRNHPVINVGWYAAREYVGWLSQKAERSYRLLSEAEWEYVGRAGSTTAFWWGQDVGKGNAHCDGCGSDDCGNEWDKSKTAPVGSFRANDFGLYDTAGNVWEWVQDCYHDNYAGAPADGASWLEGECSYRVLRGDSCLSEPGFVRSAHRGKEGPDNRYDNVGFRVARTAD